MYKEFNQANLSKNDVELVYNRLYSIYRTSDSEEVLKEIGTIFTTISDYKDSKKLAVACFHKAEIIHNDKIYYRALELSERDDINSLREAMREFAKISSYKDSMDRHKECSIRINELKKEQETLRSSMSEQSSSDNSEMYKLLFIGSMIALGIVVLTWLWSIIPKF